MSQKACEAWGIKKDAYYKAVESLINNKYLVPVRDGSNYYIFHELPEQFRSMNFENQGAAEKTLDEQTVQDMLSGKISEKPPINDWENSENKKTEKPKSNSEIKNPDSDFTKKTSVEPERNNTNNTSNNTSNNTLKDDLNTPHIFRAGKRLIDNQISGAPVSEELIVQRIHDAEDILNFAYRYDDGQYKEIVRLITIEHLTAHDAVTSVMKINTNKELRSMAGNPLFFPVTGLVIFLLVGIVFFITLRTGEYNGALVALIIVWGYCLLYGLAALSERFNFAVMTAMIFVFLLSRPIIASLYGLDWCYWSDSTICRSMTIILLGQIALFCGTVYIEGLVSGGEIRHTAGTLRNEAEIVRGLRFAHHDAEQNDVENHDHAADDRNDPERHACDDHNREAGKLNEREEQHQRAHQLPCFVVLLILCNMRCHVALCQLFHALCLTLDAQRGFLGLIAEEDAPEQIADDRIADERQADGQKCEQNRTGIHSCKPPDCVFYCSA